MRLKISVRQDRTFLRRFNENALWWGIPMVGLDLFCVPLWGWLTVLVIAIPATLAGVLAKTGIEHLLVRTLARRNEIKQH
jgi:hypothetical protein